MLPSTSRIFSAFTMLVLATLVAGMPDPSAAEAKPQAASKTAKSKTSKDASRKAPKKAPLASCQQQKPQRFLMRSNFMQANQLLPKLHARAIKYRTEQYGYVEGYGSPDWNEYPPTHYAQNTTFFGQSVRVHEKIVPALGCVEQALKKSCAKHPYSLGGVGGFRDYNSYRGGEVTNHLYGIAIDIDPERNPCCHCVEPWSSHPRCQDRKKSAYERMDMPRCWVETFERYGFYWLGHDRLEDTMHFEFLGDPSKILKKR